jgi:hypothetical protein
MASTYLSRTTGTPTQQNTWTWSAWVKFSDDNKVGATDSTLLSEYYNAGSYTKYERIANNVLRYGTGVSGHGSFVTTRRFSDLNAWYHLVIVNDWSNSTTADRIKLYVNGVRETSFSSFTAPSSGSSRINGDSEALRIGTINNTLFFNGSMSHIHFIDGTVYDASAFGETDATTGEWKIKTDVSVTYGNNGFFILKDGNSVTDQSGKGNNFTVGGGTLTKTEDNPSNVFCTMNPLDNHFASSTFSHGNNTVQTSTSNYTWNTGTLGMTSGKFYWEVKYSANSNGDYYNLIGIADRPTDDIHDVLGRQTNCSNYGYYADNGGIYAKSTSITSYGNSYTVGDIVGVAVDLDNNKLYFSKNGTWQNSGVPTSGSTGTGAFSIDAISSTITGVYFPASGDYGSSQNATNQHNFGNGYFGTTAVSSAGSNASGNGIFEYDVPTGYTALSTKGLNL